MIRKEPTPASLKALFAKSGNRCAYPMCTNALVDDLNIFVGEVCHIHAVLKKDARYDSAMSDEALRHYRNLILMCHAHHKRVDTREDLYPADALQEMKRIHEASYEERQFDANDSVLAQAAFQIIHEDWSPHLDFTIEILYSTLQQEHVTQGQMNSISANVAQIADAQLFVTYTKLFQTLNPSDQIDLYREQEVWREKRHANVESGIEAYAGTMLPTMRNSALSEYTQSRINELKERIIGT